MDKATQTLNKLAQSVPPRKRASFIWGVLSTGLRDTAMLDLFIKACEVPDMTGRGKMLDIYPTNEILGPFNDWDTMRATVLLYIEANT